MVMNEILFDAELLGISTSNCMEFKAVLKSLLLLKVSVAIVG
jgi:hypothetical protein